MCCCNSERFFSVQSWETESDRVRQKLLSLIGRIGREARVETTTGKACECDLFFFFIKHAVCSLCAFQVLIGFGFVPVGSGGPLGAGSSSNVTM